MLFQDSDNPDLRDRGYIYWRLLSTDPAAAKVSINPIYWQRFSIADTFEKKSFLNIWLGLMSFFEAKVNIYIKSPNFFHSNRFNSTWNGQQTVIGQTVQICFKSNACMIKCKFVSDLLTLDQSSGCCFGWEASDIGRDRLDRTDSTRRTHLPYLVTRLGLSQTSECFHWRRPWSGCHEKVAHCPR